MVSHNRVGSQSRGGKILPVFYKHRNCISCEKSSVGDSKKGRFKDNSNAFVCWFVGFTNQKEGCGCHHLI